MLATTFLCTENPQRNYNNMKQVLSQLRNKDLTLNKEKCAFSQENLKYLGYIFSKEQQTTAPASFPNMQPFQSL